MKKMLLAAGCFVLPGLLNAATLTLAENGTTQYRIVYTVKEKEAAEELKEHLDKISGTVFKLAEESASGDNKQPAFYVGSTMFAEKNVDFSKFSDQEWLVKTIGNDVIICGGKTRGTLYGVYELLEKEFGCRWFSYDTSLIPEQKKLCLKDVELRGMPAFDYREIVDDTYEDFWADKSLYMIKQRFKKRVRASLGYHKWFAIWPVVSPQYWECHNFYDFLDPKRYFQEHPEYFSMDAEGKRFHGNLGPTMQGGSFCMSNPDVPEIIYKKLLEFIKLDRSTLPPEKWPMIYDISQMDSCPFMCLCPECRKITEREGSESGLLLSFLNPLAERLQKDYPGVKIRTFSYASTKLPPAHIKPAKNIIIQWCNLYGFNDCYRPITSPFNAEQKKQLDDWEKTGANLAVWAYWNMGGQFFSPPRVETMVDAIKPELNYYKERGVTCYFAEAEKDPHHLQNFYRLQVYVGHRLLKDPGLDDETLITEFMKAYYGPAEKPMTQLLHMLRTAVRQEKARMRACTENTRPYCTEKFMEQVWKYLQEALQTTEPETLYRDHVEAEMLSPLFVILKNTEWAFSDRQALLERYKELRMRSIANTKGDQKEKLLARYESDLRNFVKINLPIPQGFENREVIMIGWPKLGWASQTNKESIVDDPDSVTGKALVTKKNSNGEPSDGHTMSKIIHKGFTPLNFGAYDYTTTKGIHWRFDKPIPKDEKYHWYKIGTYKINVGSFVWGFYWNTRCDLSGFWKPDDGLDNLNTWDIWVSAKITGPAYVESSQKQNDIYWDQVMLVKPE